MGSKSKKVKAPKMDIGKDISQYVSGVSKSLPGIISFEQQYRPQFQGLNLGDISAFLQGTGGQQGLFGLGGQAAQATGQTLGEARAAELGQMTGQAGATRSLFGALSPEAAAQVQRASDEASRAYQSAQSLTPQEQRMATQQAREAFGARGMLDSNAAVGAEVLSRENVLAQKRQEAAQRGAEAFGYGTSFYSQPGLAALSSVPLSYQTGQQQLQLGLGAIGAGTPQLYNIDTALNLGAAQRANQLQASIANAQASASRSAGIMSGLGSLGGSVLSAAGQAGGFAALFSDRRLKTDIKLIGKTGMGLNKYSFRYKSDPSTVHIGVMADEVEKVKPEAVTEINGYKAVYYSMIH